MERDLKLNMEAKENLKEFSTGGETRWYMSLCCIFKQRFGFSITISIFFLYFLTAPSFYLTKRKAVCFTGTARTQEEWEAFPFPGTDDCLHLTRHLLYIMFSVKFPFWTEWQLVVRKAAVFPKSRTQQESCKVRYYQVVDHISKWQVALHKEPSIFLQKADLESTGAQQHTPTSPITWLFRIAREMIASWTCMFV